ncbi:uncharacterized protein LOC119666164 [Teleopsis dalmanni]|uniref:uncharacterized protein LOC119666164 n=1 Tax=Teleopsis dalmanni TaxID=139649 RepID=UPI0018CDE0BA|nr:uncharacterized protein LOC119666164 [Teleopsis dalmanni]
MEAKVDENNKNLQQLIQLLTLKIQADEIKQPEPKIAVENVAKIISDFDGETVPVCHWFEALLAEFQKTLSSAEVHKMLSERKKKRDESFHEYVLNMKKIAVLGHVEVESVIRYIVDGLYIKNEYKFGFYSCKTYQELREKYEIFERVGESNKHEKHQFKGNEENIGSFKITHCFNCGSSQHKRAQCKEEVKCFKCNGNGHMAKECTTIKYSVNLITCERRNKLIKINNKTVKCLIDSGADVSLIRKSVYNEEFSACTLQKSDAELIGLGKAATAVIGKFQAQVKIDELQTVHTFLVVADASINVDVIAGFDLLQKFTVTLQAEGYKFSPATENDSAKHNIYKVIENNAEQQYKTAVIQMINNYKPLKLHIRPSCNDETLCEQPSGLSAPERKAIQKQVEEMNAALSMNNLIEDDKKCTMNEVYDDKQVKELRVNHNTDDFSERKTDILTLKDNDVLNEKDGDTLINLNMIDDEHYCKNVHNKKLNPINDGYDVYEEQYDQFSYSTDRNMLEKSDKDFDGKKGKIKNFVIDEKLVHEQGHRKKLVDIKTKLIGDCLETLDDTEITLASNTLSETEIEKFKKPKKRVKKLRQKLKAEDLLLLTEKPVERNEIREDVKERIKKAQEIRKGNYDKDRQELRAKAKDGIIAAQNAYKKQFDSKRKQENVYNLGDLIAIKRTQFGAGRKLASEYVGPYKVTKVKRNGRYEVEKAANTEGPNNTSTSCDNMKLWKYIINEEDLLSSESDDDVQDGRV